MLKSGMIKQSGISVLLVILIISASSLLIARGAVFLSIGELSMGNASVRGNSAYYLAQACLAEASLQYKFNNNYSATDKSLSLGNGTCVFSASGSGQTKTIRSTGFINEYRKTIEAEIDIVNGSIILQSISIIEI